MKKSSEQPSSLLLFLQGYLSHSFPSPCCFKTIGTSPYKW